MNIKIEEIESSQLRSLINKDQVTIIDVREPEETIQGIIKGAHLIPIKGVDYDDFTQRFVEELDSKAIVVYCRSGIRSAMFITELLKRLPLNQGHKLYNLRGGILAFDLGAK